MFNINSYVIPGIYHVYFHNRTGSSLLASWNEWSDHILSQLPSTHNKRKKKMGKKNDEILNVILNKSCFRHIRYCYYAKIEVLQLKNETIFNK